MKGDAQYHQQTYDGACSCHVCADVKHEITQDAYRHQDDTCVYDLNGEIRHVDAFHKRQQQRVGGQCG